MGFIDNLRDVFGIETKAEKEAKIQSEQKAFGTSQKVEQPASDKEKEEKERVWKDVSDPFKYVCQGGKAECKYCKPSIADLIATSNTLKLQGKPFMTVGDKDGKMNFNFPGICTHSSHGSNKPPCKAVISLGGWKDFSETNINDDKALLVKSTIPCMISGEYLKITDSGQKSVISDVSVQLPKIQVKIISLDTENFTPLGIQNPVHKDIKTSEKFTLKYEISGQKASTIRFCVYSKDEDLIGFESLSLLKEVTVTSEKKANKFSKVSIPIINLDNRVLKEEHLDIGTHVIKWDGFDDEGLLDTSKLMGKLRFQVSVVGSDGLNTVGSSLTVKTEKIEPAAKWVTALITKKDIDKDGAIIKIRNIDVSLNINLVDGGEKGLSCNTYHYSTGGSSTLGIPGEYHSGTVCDWDKVTGTDVDPEKVIKTRSRSFDDLVNMVLKGVKTYWSRNGTRDNGVTVGSDNYIVNVQPINTTLKPPYSLDDIPLIYNTNGDWGRSGNPGGSSYGLGVVKLVKGIDALINMIQQITYSVGYLRNSSGKWYFEDEAVADKEFTETAAHELGHEILQAFGGDIYSYQHKGTSYLFPQDIKPTTPDSTKWYNKTLVENIWDWSKDQMKDIKGENAPSTGEQDLMKYYNGSKAYERIVAEEDDVKGLIWLTSIKMLK